MWLIVVAIIEEIWILKLWVQSIAQDTLNWINWLPHGNNSSLDGIALLNRLNLVITISGGNLKLLILTTHGDECSLNCSPINSSTIVEGSLISKGKGSNLLAVLLLYLKVLNVVLVWLKLITSSVTQEEITRIYKTVQNVHVSGITSKIVVIPLWANLYNWLS